MTLGQSLLALGALSLTMYIGVNVNRITTSTVATIVDHHHDSEALNYSQSLAESEFAKEYSSLTSLYTDVATPSKRLSYTGQMGAQFYATIHYSNEVSLKLGTFGKIATIRIYTIEDNAITLSITRTLALVKPN